MIGSRKSERFLHISGNPKPRLRAEKSVTGFAESLYRTAQAISGPGINSGRYRFGKY